MKHELKNFPVGNKQCDGAQGPCGNHTAERQRQHTAYADDPANWVTLCPECAAANADYWDELWREFFAGRV